MVCVTLSVPFCDPVYVFSAYVYVFSAETRSQTGALNVLVVRGLPECVTFTSFELEAYNEHRTYAL